VRSYIGESSYIGEYVSTIERSDHKIVTSIVYANGVCICLSLIQRLHALVQGMLARAMRQVIHKFN
jgi:hypothetical protein